MKIAVTYENGQIFQHFGHTEQFKPVSYTHLDVYKRQELRCISPLRRVRPRKSFLVVAISILLLERRRA